MTRFTHYLPFEVEADGDNCSINCPQFLWDVSGRVKCRLFFGWRAVGMGRCPRCPQCLKAEKEAKQRESAKEKLPVKLKKIRTCNRCKALLHCVQLGVGAFCTPACALGFAVAGVYSIEASKFEGAVPMELCPKPRTLAELRRCEDETWDAAGDVDTRDGGTAC